MREREHVTKLGFISDCVIYNQLELSLTILSNFLAILPHINFFVWKHSVRFINYHTVGLWCRCCWGIILQTGNGIKQFYTFYMNAFCLFMRFIHDGPIYVRSWIYYRVQQANKIASAIHLSCVRTEHKVL